MQLRAYVLPSISESKSAYSASDRDLTLLVSHDHTVEEIKLAAGDHIASSTFEIDLNEGSVAHYPLDSYVARLGVQLLDGKSSLRLPARVTTWEGLLGYGLHTTSQPGADPNDVQLTTTIARSGAFALCAYGAMLVLGCCAVAIGVLTFIDVRRAEATLIGALAAITFALPRVAQRASGLASPRRRGGHVGVFVDRTRRRAGACALGFQMGESRSRLLRRQGRRRPPTTSAWRRRADRSPGWRSTS